MVVVGPVSLLLLLFGTVGFVSASLSFMPFVSIRYFPSSVYIYLLRMIMTKMSLLLSLLVFLVLFPGGGSSILLPCECFYG